MCSLPYSSNINDLTWTSACVYLRFDQCCFCFCVSPSEMLLDDFLLTYLVFMTTHDLCQALLGQYPYFKKKHYPQNFDFDCL